MLPSLRVMSPWELIWHRPKEIHWPTLSHGDKADHKRDEELWSRGSAAHWWYCHLGPGFSSGPGKGKGGRQTPIFCVLRPYPGPLPLEETVTLEACHTDNGRKYPSLPEPTPGSRKEAKKTCARRPSLLHSSLKDTKVQSRLRVLLSHSE